MYVPKKEEKKSKCQKGEGRKPEEATKREQPTWAGRQMKVEKIASKKDDSYINHNFGVKLLPFIDLGVVSNIYFSYINTPIHQVVYKYYLFLLPLSMSSLHRQYVY